MSTMPKTSTKRKVSAEDYAAKIQDLRDRFDEWSEDQDEATLALLVALHDGYSERNSLLIAMQDPEATDVSGYKEWLARGRQVRKGEHGIAILAPAGHRDEEKNDAGEVTTKGRQFFRLAYVFDVRQTDPKEV